MQYKRPLNNNKILNRKATVYANEEVENGAMKHDMKSILYLHYLTSTKSFTLLYLLSSKLQDFRYHINRNSKGLCRESKVICIKIGNIFYPLIILTIARKN